MHTPPCSGGGIIAPWRPGPGGRASTAGLGGVHRSRLARISSKLSGKGMLRSLERRASSASTDGVFPAPCASGSTLALGEAGVSSSLGGVDKRDPSKEAASGELDLLYTVKGRGRSPGFLTSGGGSEGRGGDAVSETTASSRPSACS